MRFLFTTIALATMAAPTVAQEQPEVGEFSECVIRESIAFSKGADPANLIVDAALIKCRPILAAYLNSAPKDSLAARQDAREMTREALTRMAKDQALLKVIELRASQ
jgi:hypothetical protein